MNERRLAQKLHPRDVESCSIWYWLLVIVIQGDHACFPAFNGQSPIASGFTPPGVSSPE
jgi:hypothetical protein